MSRSISGLPHTPPSIYPSPKQSVQRRALRRSMPTASAWGRPRPVPTGCSRRSCTRSRLPSAAPWSCRSILAKAAGDCAAGWLPGRRASVGWRVKPFPIRPASLKRWRFPAAWRIHRPALWRCARHWWARCRKFIPCSVMSRPQSCCAAWGPTPWPRPRPLPACRLTWSACARSSNTGRTTSATWRRSRAPEPPASGRADRGLLAPPELCPR